MEAVVGLLLMWLGVSHGVETHCDGRQDGAQCYGAVGGTVDIQLMDSTSEISKYHLSKDSSRILDVRNNGVISNTIAHRSLFFPSNGTFRISNLSKNDSGKYILQTFDSNGASQGVRTLELFIQAPVSSVLVPECLSQGEMRVSCSSEGGDSPQYSWTLDGRTLTDAELQSVNNESNIITLKQHVSGRLVCSVRNNVSDVSTEQTISTCFIFINCTSTNRTQISGWVHKDNNTLCIKPTTEPTATATPLSTGKETSTVLVTQFNNETSNTDDQWYIRHLPLIGGVLSALVIFLVVGVAVICAQRKKQNNKPTKQKEEECDQDVTYADVRIMKQQGKQTAQTVQEVEVEYGQVKFSRRSRHTEQTGDDSMYAKVQRVR